MIYKNTSVKRVIAKVFTDLDLKEGSHRVPDMIEWAGEALEKIGAFPSFENKVTGKDDIPILVVENYQAKLPCDFYKLIQVAYSSNENGPFYPMRYATGNFDWGAEVNEVTTNEIVYPESAIVTLAMSLYDLSYEDALRKINNEPATRALLNSMLTDADTRSSVTGSVEDLTYDYTYLIKPGYIQTNSKTGYIMMSYQAIPTDEDGYPLIPDDISFIEAIYWYISFIEAIYWYITMKLLYSEWRSGRVRDAVYYDARRSWNYYSKQAYGNALMPNRDQLESIKNTWVRLVPNMTEWSSSFSTLGERQVIHDSNKPYFLSSE
jgi:hypothetical protein